MNRDECWYADGLRFQCQPGCTDCCGGAPGDVWVDADARRAIAEALALPLGEFNRRYVRRSATGHSLTERPNYDCILLTESGCAVYPVRPRQCRTFPFWDEHLASLDAWEQLGSECPGIGKGRLWTREEIDRIRQ